MKTLTQQEAEELGYRSITKPYKPVAEKEIFDRCVATLEGTTSAMVPMGDGCHEVWRHKSELDIYGEG